MSYRPPTLGRKEVDLYRLFREVTAYGGCDSVVSKEGTWAKIYRGLDNFSPTETSASFRLKKMYNKYLLAYEKHVFNFLPIPAKKHRFHMNSAGTPLNSVNPINSMNSMNSINSINSMNSMNSMSSVSPISTMGSSISNSMSNSQTVSTGIQNSIIFPPNTYTYTDETPAKRPTKGIVETAFTGSHTSALLSNSTHYTPGAGIGLTAGVSWNASLPSMGVSPVKRPASDGGSVGDRDAHALRSGSPRVSQIVGETVEPDRQNTRSRSSLNSPLVAGLSGAVGTAGNGGTAGSVGSAGLGGRSAGQGEQKVCHSPMITGEDPEGAAGLQALMTLRTSLSPTLRSVEEA